MCVKSGYPAICFHRFTEYGLERAEEQKKSSFTVKSHLLTRHFDESNSRSFGLINRSTLYGGFTLECEVHLQTPISALCPGMYKVRC